LNDYRLQLTRPGNNLDVMISPLPCQGKGCQPGGLPRQSVPSCSYSLGSCWTTVQTAALMRIRAQPVCTVANRWIRCIGVA